MKRNKNVGKPIYLLHDITLSPLSITVNIWAITNENRYRTLVEYCRFYVAVEIHITKSNWMPIAWLPSYITSTSILQTIIYSFHALKVVEKRSRIKSMQCAQELKNSDNSATSNKNVQANNLALRAKMVIITKLHDWHSFIVRQMLTHPRTNAQLWSGQWIVILI